MFTDLTETLVSLRPFARAAVALVLRLADGTYHTNLGGKSVSTYFREAEEWLEEFRNWTGK